MKLSHRILSVLIAPALFAPATAGEARFFPGAGMDFGVYYYPEHWPEDQWERDIGRIAALGFDFIHCAEFAWQRMEPADGEFDFAWLDRVVDLAGKNGLGVLMSTPTPCPPAWLATKHPEVLCVDRNGRRIHHNGARLTPSLANPIYRKHAARIVGELARRYGPDERIIGWQIGNEPHIATGSDYSPSALKAFVAWLREKYGTIEAVNEAWGGPFWSYGFSSFDEIRMPFPTMPGPNPHTHLDFQTYTSEEIARDLIDQARLLREHTRDAQWITTNYARFQGLPNVNPFLTRDDLDFAAHTMYLTSNRFNDAGDSLSHRLGSGLEYAFGAELARSVSGYSGIMELQPGQINWGRFNAMPLPGAVRMWVWHAFGLGHRFVCTYRYRQPLFGVEQFHHGIMQTDGVTLSRGGGEFVTAMKEIRKAVAGLDPAATSPRVERTRTAFLWSNRNMMDLEAYRHHEDWDSWQHLYTYYQALKRMAVEVEIVDEADEISPATHPFMVVPAYQMMSRELVAKLERYAGGGGHLVISTRSCLKDARGHLWEMPIQKPIWNLIGGEIEFYDHLPRQRPGKLDFDGEPHDWHIWGTVVTPSAGTSSWGSYLDQFYHGKSAILHRTLGEGTVTYVGAWSDDWEMEYQVLRRVFGKVAGEDLHDLPPYLFVHDRRGLRVAVNYTAQVHEMQVPGGAPILPGGRAIPPGGVLVWKPDH